MRAIRSPKILKKKRCKWCEEEFQPKTSLESICSYNCAIERAKDRVKKKLEKAEKEEKKKGNIEKREGLEKLKTKSEYEKDLEKEVNQIVRLIDKGHPCISSDRNRYIVNAGHFYAVGSNPAIRYNLLNIFAQCVGDNMYRGGCPLDYKMGLQKTFGSEIAQEVEELRSNYLDLKLTIPELKEIIKTARKVVRELIKETSDLEKPFTISERIERRRYYNQVLNIYK
jgi:hypothetical protein